MADFLQEVEKALLFRCPDLLHKWLPGGKQSGHYYKCANLQGGEGISLTVNLRSGQWGDWAEGGAKGSSGGNLVSLYAAINGIEWKDALFKLAEEVGIQRPAKGKPQTWRVVTPVPPGIIQYDNNGEAIPPRIKATDGVSDSWSYLDRDGNVIGFRLRWNKPDGSKEVKPLSYCRNKETGLEEWRLIDFPEPRPLYNLHLLAFNPEKTLIVEGEKTARAAARLLPEWTVTTWPGGSSAIRKADWSIIRANSNSHIVLWADNDAPGLRAMSEVSEEIQREHDIVRMDPAWMPKWDLADAEAEGWTTEKVEAYIAKNSVRVDPEPAVNRPEIDLSGKDTYRHMIEVYSAMEEIGAEVYVFNQETVYVRRSDYGHLDVAGMSAKEFRPWSVKKLAPFHYNGNGKSPCSISDELAAAVIFNAPGRLPALRRFSAVPIFTQDGRLLDTPGYHKDVKVFVDIPKEYDPDLPFERALEVIEDLLHDFPFESPSDKTNAISFVITAIMRDTIQGPTPLFRFEAPSPGTGKSLLCRALCEIVTPHPAECSMPDEEEELRKRLTSTFMTSPSVIMFDNVGNLESEILMMALSEDIWGDRLLGQNRNVKLPIRNLWTATLNNPTMTKEVFRRSVRVRLNAKAENPEERPLTSFTHYPLIPYVRQNRGLFVSAFIALAKMGVGYAASVAPPMGTYESWVAACHPILEACGYEGYLANRADDRRMSGDSRQEAFEDFMAVWIDRFGTSEVPLSELVSIAIDIAELPVRRSKEGKINAASLSKLIKSKHDCVFQGLTVGLPRHTREGSVIKLSGDAPAKRQEESGNYALPYKDDSEF